MATVSHPGVYLQEAPGGMSAITSVSTAITAFVDCFSEGPVNQATEVSGLAEFEHVFGGLDARSEASYAITQFFLNGGTRAVVVRTHAASDAAPFTAATVGLRSVATVGAPAVMTLVAASEGSWGNSVRAEVDLHTADPTRFFNLTLTRHASAASDAPVLQQEQHLAVTLDPADPRHVVRVLAADSRLARAEVPAPLPGTPLPVPLPVGTLGGTLPTAGPALADLLDTLRCAPPAAVQPLPRRLRVQVGGGQTFEATLPTWSAHEVTTLAQLAARLQGALRTAVGTAAAGAPTPPVLAGATVSVVGNARLSVTPGRGDPGRRLTDTLMFNLADDAATLMGLTSTATVNVAAYPLGSALGDVGAFVQGVPGADGEPPGAAELVGPAADANDRGLYALRQADLFNLLAIPRAASLDDAQMREVVQDGIAFCEARRAFMLVDIPEHVNAVADVRDWLAAHGEWRSRNAALFFPRLRMADPKAGGRLRSFAASGTLAGVFARIDGDRGVWKAPAGIEATLLGVDALDCRLDDTENGLLNPLAINCLRAFPPHGLVNWGARTLEGSDTAGSQWQYIPVRRLALMLEESLVRGTRWAVFEPNDEPLWAKVRLSIGAYLNALFRQGAFQGSNPKEAYFVRCDATTTSQTDRDRGIVRIEVGFAPLKPAEFVVLTIRQMSASP